MDLDLIILGTAASVPTANRGLSSMLIRRGGERILIDCGEGTQRQLMRSCGLGDIDLILLTHMHADHVLGLPGMLKTFGLRDREMPLTIAGPPGIRSLFRTLDPLIGKLSYDIDVVETEGDVVWGNDEYEIESIPTRHSVRSVGYRLMEFDRPGFFDVDAARSLGVPNGPLYGRLQRGESITLDDGTTVEPAQVVGEPRSGRRIVYSGDTAACGELRDAAHEASVLIHEATFLHDDEQRARDTGHCTAHDAALLALAARVDMLALTHISTRYRVREIRHEAREVFDNVIVPRDFDRIEVPFLERGRPVHIQEHNYPAAEAVPAT